MRIGMHMHNIAYAYRLSGDPALRQVLVDALEAWIASQENRSGSSGMGKGFSQMLIFLHEGLWPLVSDHP